VREPGCSVPGTGWASGFASLHPVWGTRGARSPLRPACIALGSPSCWGCRGWCPGCAGWGRGVGAEDVLCSQCSHLPADAAGSVHFDQKNNNNNKPQKVFEAGGVGVHAGLGTPSGRVCLG